MSNKKEDSIIKYYFFVCLFSFGIYLNSLGNDFVFDDEAVVLGDPSLNSTSNIPKYFTGTEGFQKIIGRYFRPIVNTSYNLDNAIYDYKPFGFHLTNVLIHVINSLLVLHLLFLMFESVKSKWKNIFITLGAVVFAVHPIHTEAVSWVSGRTDSLCFTFFAAAFIYWVKYSSSIKTKELVLCGVMYFVSLLAKEMAITFPVLVILYDVLVRKETDVKKKLKPYFVLIVLSIIYFLYRYFVLMNTPVRESYLYFFGKDTATIFFTMLQTIPVYLKLVVFPMSMLYHYTGFLPYINSFADTRVLISIALIISLIAFAVYLIRKDSNGAYAIFFFFVSLLPVMNIVPTMNFMADRFLYLPSFCVSFAVVSVLLKYFDNKKRQAAILVCVLLIGFYSVLTFSRNAEWKNNDTLFLSADGKPGTVVYVNIGNIYANRQQYDKAEELYRKAIELRKETILAHNNIGKIFMMKQNFDSAFHYINYAYSLDTLSPETMHTLGQLYASFNQFPEAIMWLEKVQSVSPNYMNSMAMLNDVKSKQQMMLMRGDSMKVKPEDLKQTAILEKESYKLYQEKKYDESVKILLKLVELNPAGSSGYYNNAGMCYLEQDKLKEAEKYFLLSVKSDEKFSTGYNNLVTVYEKMGDKKKSEEYKKLFEKNK